VPPAKHSRKKGGQRGRLFKLPLGF
jgi:hypothetical protein